MTNTSIGYTYIHMCIHIYTLYTSNTCTSQPHIHLIHFLNIFYTYTRTYVCVCVCVCVCVSTCQAYEALIDEQKRADYNMYGKAAFQPPEFFGAHSKWARPNSGYGSGSTHSNGRPLHTFHGLGRRDSVPVFDETFGPFAHDRRGRERGEAAAHQARYTRFRAAGAATEGVHASEPLPASCQGPHLVCARVHGHTHLTVIHVCARASRDDSPSP